MKKLPLMWEFFFNLKLDDTWFLGHAFFIIEKQRKQDSLTCLFIYLLYHRYSPNAKTPNKIFGNQEAKNVGKPTFIAATDVTCIEKI